MIQDISQTGSDKRWWDYRELFNTREVRYRSMLVIIMGMPCLISPHPNTTTNTNTN